MKIYNSEQVKKSLKCAGFTDIKIHKNKKTGYAQFVKKIIYKLTVVFSTAQMIISFPFVIMLYENLPVAASNEK